MSSHEESIPTGHAGLDQAIGIGGIPRGKLTEFFGHEGTAQHITALCTVREAQKAGRVAAWVDVAHGFDMQEAGARRIVLRDLLVSQPDTGEQALDITEVLVRSGGVDLVVIDFAGGLRGGEDPSEEDSKAREFSRALRTIAACASKHQVAILFLRTSPTCPRKSNPAGVFNTLKFYTSVRVEFSIVSGTKRGRRHVRAVRAKVIKNRVAAPFMECEMEIEA